MIVKYVIEYLLVHAI